MANGRRSAGKQSRGEKKMKTGTKILMGVIILLALFTGARVSAADVQPIVPAAGGAAGANSYQYEISETASASVTSVPVRVEQGGRVQFDIMIRTESEDFGLVLSNNSDLRQALQTKDVLDLSTNCKPSEDGLRRVKLQSCAQGACTWYLHLFALDGRAMSATVSAYHLDTVSYQSDGELKKGKWLDGFSYTGKPACYKITAAKTGCLKIETSTDVNITLLDGKKKEIGSAGGGVYGKDVYFAVKKGVYYVRVEGFDSFRIRYTLESIQLQKNTKKTKAAVLKKGKTSKNMFLLGAKSAEHWYKITVDKNKSVKINIRLSANAEEENFHYYLTQQNGKKQKQIEDDDLEAGKETLRVKLKKGTYYLRMTGTGNGAYSVSWK